MLNKEIKKYQDKVQAFADERDWDQFHTLKNLTMAMSVECSELMEHFQWVKSSLKKEDLNAKKIEKVEEEMIDVFIYWMRIADKLDLDIEKSFESKFKKNQEKYPAEIVRGSHKKYNEY
ncbi:MAG: nucleotide pyrophosphohydrolase [Halobacteriovoraceae bacterium]|nr:nucleotide pyrophosphohydrolase [Halobacteriovoraceae bacterium]